jgi:Holliday junction resolvase RusA-like endonuclease
MYRQRIDIDPVAAARARVSKTYGTFTPAKYAKFKQDLAILWKGPRSGKEMTMRFYFPVAPSATKKERKELLEKGMHRFKPDIDNLVKAVLDSIIDTDAKIWSIKAEKVWTEDKHGSIDIEIN